MFLWVAVKNEEEASEKIIKMSRNNNFTTGNRLDFGYFKENYRLTVTDLSKKIKSKDFQQINFIGKLENPNNGAKVFFNITKFCQHLIKMETQKIENMLNSFENKVLTFATRKWSVIESESNVTYSQFWVDYSDVYVLVTGNIIVEGSNNNTKVAFTDCAPFRKCRTKVNDTFFVEAEHINIAVPINIWLNVVIIILIIQEVYGSLKRDEIEGNIDLTVDAQHISNNSSSFKYKSSLITDINGA